MVKSTAPCQRVFSRLRTTAKDVSAFGQHQKFPPHLRKTSGTQGKTDIALDLLPVPMMVNATFAQHLHLGAKIMGSHGFEGHLQMVQMCREICFFELYLHVTQMIAQICCFAQLLL